MLGQSGISNARRRVRAEISEWSFQERPEVALPWTDSCGAVIGYAGGFELSDPLNYRVEQVKYHL